MKTNFKKVLTFMMSIVLLFACVSPIRVSAAGTETLPLGEYYVGDFTFTDQNLTPIKTMPAAAEDLYFKILFYKANIDAGIGPVKLNVQVRDVNTGEVLLNETMIDQSGWVGGQYNRFTTFYTSRISVYPGQKIQILFDASSVDYLQSNGAYRSITLYFSSYINCY